jgi:hypothetical protein
MDAALPLSSRRETNDGVFAGFVPQAKRRLCP